jgi:hypothetical protein
MLLLEISRNGRRLSRRQQQQGQEHDILLRGAPEQHAPLHARKEACSPKRMA